MFLKLDEYLKGAQKILSIYGYKCHINDDDAISFVAYYMMKADQTWDGKSSSRDTWRFNQAKYAILKLKTAHRKRKARREISLFMPIGKMGDRDIFLCNTIEDKKSTNHIQKSFEEVLNVAKNKLTETQFKCISMYYCENTTMQDVGNKLGITKQMVSLHIKNAEKVLRHELVH